MSHATHTAEVLIVGAGPAGSALAALLTSAGREVLLIDRATFPRDKTCGDGLTPSAVACLERLGVLAEIEAAGAQRILGARLFPAEGAAWTMTFSDHDFGLPPYGLALPRYGLDHILLQNAVTRGASFLPGFHAVSPLFDVEGGRVAGISGEVDGRYAEAHGRLTVLAVGANVGLLRAFGVLEKMPLGINAIRGYFDGIADLGAHFEFYFERELAPGYAWVFPLAYGRANIGLGVLERGPKKEHANLRRLLEDFVGRSARLRHAIPMAAPKGFPIRIDFPRCRPIGDGYMLVGEALGLVNPVTGEGIGMALESAELAARIIEDSLKAGDVSERGLEAYERELNARYGNFFRGMNALLRLGVRPRAISILVRQAQEQPRLAELIAGINLGVASPWEAFSPRTWWDILR
jgi:geranylgeranyl reductase family protein